MTGESIASCTNKEFTARLIYILTKIMVVEEIMEVVEEIVVEVAEEIVEEVVNKVRRF